jgi:hypothetical protein
MRYSLCRIPQLNYAEDKQKSFSHENGNVRNNGQGKTPNKIHKRLKLGGGQLHDCSGVYTAVVM